MPARELRQRTISDFCQHPGAFQSNRIKSVIFEPAIFCKPLKLLKSLSSDSRSQAVILI